MSSLLNCLMLPALLLPVRAAATMTTHPINRPTNHLQATLDLTWVPGTSLEKKLRKATAPEEKTVTVTVNADKDEGDDKKKSDSSDKKKSDGKDKDEVSHAGWFCRPAVLGRTI